MKKEAIDLKESNKGYVYEENWREEKDGGNSISIV